ncbi:carbohydrate ABC transporter permease [Paenibacillus qinlingensis]|uniref:Raffinose/stachyose/melibiose transport system permease protein n=1 Tax=Paenibacillus qinlingensis TaxID=1837343 RepID=A0ABU1NYB4_9BACL|nr:carbohydrate ABC transporter permease [Paenibacillus qinlingensis]MDR6552495.1 raffinose/stachyose/melibiose transport system permease protein [Paenibacillus qinlingensis]
MLNARDAAAAKPAIIRRRKSFSILKVIVIIFLSLLVVTQVYPLLWLFIYSLKTNEEILSGRFFALPHVLQWSNFSNAVKAGHYFQYLKNSLFVTLITMVSVLFLSSLTAFAITRFKWKYGPLVMVIFLIGMMVPMQATLLPLMLIFKNLSILNTHLSIILPYIAFQTPVAVFILSGFMRSIPAEIEESAVVDGAGIFKIFTGVILPISVPPMMTVCILTFINIWNEYILAATFISSERLKTLPFGVNSFVSQYSVNYGAIGAFLVLGALPVIIVYFLLADKITKGMVAGAVKG